MCVETICVLNFIAFGECKKFLQQKSSWATVRTSVYRMYALLFSIWFLYKNAYNGLLLVVSKFHCGGFTQELTLVTKPGEGFGFSISGGVNGHPGNPFDVTDEGIFISQVG